MRDGYLCKFAHKAVSSNVIKNCPLKTLSAKLEHGNNTSALAAIQSRRPSTNKRLSTRLITANIPNTSPCPRPAGHNSYLPDHSVPRHPVESPASFLLRPKRQYHQCRLSQDGLGMDYPGVSCAHSACAAESELGGTVYCCFDMVVLGHAVVFWTAYYG